LAAIWPERYNRYNAYGVTYSAELIRVLEEWGGSCLPVDIGLAGGEDVRLGPDLLLQVLHVPGHTPGHLMLWEPHERVAIIGDALNGATQIDRDGAWTAPPPYTDREGYLASLERARVVRQVSRDGVAAWERVAG